MAIADELIAILGFDLQGEDAAKRYENLIGQINRRLDEMVLTAGRVAGYAAAAIATGVGIMGRSVVNASAQFETFTETLTTMEGSADKAQESLAWIAEFGRQTPYDLAGVTDAFIQLKAYGIDPIANDTLRTLGDTASSMGKTLDDAVQMFTDASGMEFERLKEFGIRATQAGDEVTFAWTENGEEMTRTVKKNGDEVRAFILENLGDRFSGAMDRQSRTYVGMMSNLGDSWQDFQRRIGAAGFFDAVKEKLQGLLDIIQRLDQSGRLDQWAEAISDSLTTALDALWAIGTRIMTNAIFIADNWEALSGYVYAVAGAIGLLIARAFPLLTAMTLVALVIDDVLAYMQGGESIIGDFIAWIRNLTGIGEDAAEALAGLAVAVGSALTLAFLVTPLRTLSLFKTLIVASVRATSSAAVWAATVGFGRMRGALTTAIAAARSAGVAAMTALGPAFRVALSAGSAAIRAGITAALFLLTNPIGWAILLAGAAAGLIWYFWDDIEVAWAAVEGWATDLFSQLKDWILAIDWLGLGMSMMTAIFDGLKAIGEGIRDWFMSLFTLPEWMSGPGPRAPRTDWYDPSILQDRLAQDMPMSGAGTGISDTDMQALRNYLDNTGTLSNNSAATPILNDHSQDNRSAPLTVSTTVHQTVTQATDAPAAAANATGAAVSRRAAEQRSQIETEPSF